MSLLNWGKICEIIFYELNYIFLIVLDIKNFKKIKKFQNDFIDYLCNFFGTKGNLLENFSKIENCFFVSMNHKIKQ